MIATFSPRSMFRLISESATCVPTACLRNFGNMPTISRNRYTGRLYNLYVLLNRDTVMTDRPMVALPWQGTVRNPESHINRSLNLRQALVPWPDLAVCGADHDSHLIIQPGNLGI